MERKPPPWYGRGYGGYPGWNAAVEQCRRLLVEWATRGYAGTYKEVTEAVDAIPWPHGPYSHRGSQIGHLLGTISVAEWLEGRPILAALVVRADDRIPGPGFFNLAWVLGLLSSKSEEAKVAFWAEEVRRCHAEWGQN